MSACICESKEPTKETTKCPKCNCEFEYIIPDELLPFYCPSHKKISICGLPMYVCESCKSDGWICYSGHGGPPYMENIHTKEKYDIKYDINNNNELF